MRSGAVSAQPPLAPPIDASASGFWPTATGAEPRSSGGNPQTTGTHGTTLTDRAVRLWHTPTAAEGGSGPGLHTGRGRASNLRTEVAGWPTPTARDGKGAFTGHRNGGRDLPGQAAASLRGRQDLTTTTPGGTSPAPMVLNPRFVEWLMGWPIGWTDCTRPATASFRWWLRTHSSALHNGPD